MIKSQQKNEITLLMTDQEREIYHKIRKLLVEMGHDDEAITEDASFTNDLGFDSLDIAEFVMQMEVMFDIAISYEYIETGCSTLLEIVQTISQLETANKVRLKDA
ncbi:MAG: acyl carrier protein [Saprospiraceae bacterium]|nr:acyl carrier protein [Saprospiraceae bacterium]